MKPWEYPGPPVARAGVLLGARFLPMTIREGWSLADAVVAPSPTSRSTLRGALRARHASPIAERSLVVAVGSNATLAVMLRKAVRGGVSPVVPVVPAVVRNLAVGHSAHISAAGYVAAAPFHARGRRSDLVGQWLDAQQLRALDATEPNYRRVHVRTRDYPLDLVGGLDVDGFWVYESRWGVLGVAGTPVPLFPQRHIQQVLRRLGVLAHGAGRGTPGAREGIAELRDLADGAPMASTLDVAAVRDRPLRTSELTSELRTSGRLPSRRRRRTW